MLLALVTLALAEPTRCVATWTGPTRGCAIRGELTATGAAPSERGAERATRKQLSSVATLTIAATRARIPAMESAEFVLCEDSIQESAFLNCFADATLAQEAFCFVELADPECWSGDVLQVEDVGWRALEAGRKQMCDAVDKRLVELSYTDLATRRTVCAASCAAKTTVRCPSG